MHLHFPLGPLRSDKATYYLLKSEYPHRNSRDVFWFNDYCQGSGIKRCYLELFNTSNTATLAATNITDNENIISLPWI